MGSKFVEKHRRKSVLAVLLFLFQGRVKYVSIFFVLAILSTPFVISSETINRMIELRPVAAFLKAVGLGDMVSAIHPRYSGDELKAALDKAATDSAQNSFWAKFLKSINATMPPDGGPSSLAMLRGGRELFGPLEIKEGKTGKRGPGQVKGAVNEEEKQRGENGDDVDFKGLLAGGPGTPGGPGSAGGDSGSFYGDLMGQNMAGSFGGGSASGSGPYLSRTMSGGGGSGGRAAGMYGKVLGQSASKVPVPGSPQKVNTKKMGRVSGFTWKNVGYKTSNAKVDIKLNSKKPMFQLAETFAMTGSAFKSKDSAYEYQAAYVGTTYDGNDSNLDVIQTDAEAPVVPDTAFTGDLITGTMELQELAKKCSDAQGTYGAQMSYDGKMMDEVARTLGNPPMCCSSGVGAWNAKIDRIMGYCYDYNSNEAQLTAACQNTSSPMQCNYGSKMKIKPCSKLLCFLMIFLMILIGFLLGGLLGVLIAGMIIGAMISRFNAISQQIGDKIRAFLSQVEGGFTKPK